MGKFKIKNFRELGVFSVLIVMAAALSIVSPVFLKPVNLVNVIRQTVEIGIMAAGMTFLIIAGEMDLSVGSIFGATAMLSALMFRSDADPTLVFVVSLLAGGAIGFLNGFLVTKAKMPAFIATLGTMQIFRSVAYGISGGESISVFPERVLNSWVFKIGSSVGNVPVQIFVMAALFLVAGVTLAKTRLGFNIYATGGNGRAAKLTGINTDRTKIICFVSTGILCSLAGLISIAYLQSVPTTAGSGREMDVIAAVILGGAALSGGRGTILGTLTGAIIMSVVKNGMVLLSVPVFWQSGFIGVIIILAVLLDTWMKRKEQRE